MNVASYIKFDDISNAILEIRPTRLADPIGDSPADVGNARPRNQPLLDTSFDIGLAFSSALDKLQQSLPSSQQQTPALGEYPFLVEIIRVERDREALASYCLIVFASPDSVTHRCRARHCVGRRNH